MWAFSLMPREWPQQFRQIPKVWEFGVFRSAASTGSRPLSSDTPSAHSGKSERLAWRGCLPLEQARVPSRRRQNVSDEHVDIADHKCVRLRVCRRLRRIYRLAPLKRDRKRMIRRVSNVLEFIEGRNCGVVSGQRWVWDSLS